ncbi:hypothetical protein CRG86_003475 [Photobacterium leiognathi]|nr:hypothetical protein CRG86_003475 [Photobacterium leiognathi]
MFFWKLVLWQSEFLILYLVAVYKSTSVQKYEHLSVSFYCVLLGGVNKAEGKEVRKEHKECSV